MPRSPRDPDGTRWYRTGDAGVLEDGCRPRARPHRQRHRLRWHQRVARPRRAHRARRAGARGGRGDRGARSEVGRGQRRRGAPGRGAAPQRVDPAARRRATRWRRIGPHARPGRLVLVDELETLPSGKPDREAIRRPSRASPGTTRLGVDVDDAEAVALGVFQHHVVGVLGIPVPVDLAGAEARADAGSRRPGRRRRDRGAAAADSAADSRSPRARCWCPVPSRSSSPAGRGSPSPPTARPGSRTRAPRARSRRHGRCPRR